MCKRIFSSNRFFLKEEGRNSVLLKILRRDLQKKKSITGVLFLFVFLAAILIACGTGMISKLFQSMDYLFMKAETPHFVQMHAGEINKQEIEEWAMNHLLVSKQQTVEMLNIDGTKLLLGNKQEPEINSVMDISFVKQNDTFDYLLDLENELIHLSSGEIAVPIYYMVRDHLQIGDEVSIINGTERITFTISHFLRDSLMNPSMVHSKRFLVSDEDYQLLNTHIKESEYLIEFLLTDIKQLNNFSQSYQESPLPSGGPTLDYQTFKILNGLTEGILAVTIIFISLLLIVIAVLCLRLTILATLEEDYREIGVMKAIGINQAYMKKIYLSKYVVIAAAASMFGYLVSLWFSPLFTQNMATYLGLAPRNIVDYGTPFVAALLIYIFCIACCRMTLRKFSHISAVEALRAGKTGSISKGQSILPIYKNRFVPINLLLAIKDLCNRGRIYLLLFVVYIICTFIMIVPVNFLNTIHSSSFITYMGIGQSDLRIDLQQSEDMSARFGEILTYIEKDADVEKFTPLVVKRLKVVGSDGRLENMNVETGDMSLFPLEYLKGNLPKKENEIALSYLNSEELKKDVGDILQLEVDGKMKDLIVSGIYQDITNGGRTAKAIFPTNHEQALWYVISLNLMNDVDVPDKMQEYLKVFHPAKVTDIKGYLAETLGDTIEQLRLLTIIAIVITLGISILISTLFVKMIVVKDSSQNAILRSIGFSLRDIQGQYVIRLLAVLFAAIISGTILANTVGQNFVSALWSMMGAARIEFVINPVHAYLLCPFLLLVAVTVTTFISTNSIANNKISEMNAD